MHPDQLRALRTTPDLPLQIVLSLSKPWDRAFKGRGSQKDGHGVKAVRKHIDLNTNSFLSPLQIQHLNGPWAWHKGNRPPTISLMVSALCCNCVLVCVVAPNKTSGRHIKTLTLARSRLLRCSWKDAGLFSAAGKQRQTNENVAHVDTDERHQAHEMRCENSQGKTQSRSGRQAGQGGQKCCDGFCSTVAQIFRSLLCCWVNDLIRSYWLCQSCWKRRLCIKSEICPQFYLIYITKLTVAFPSNAYQSN